jgi:transmembrane sensor
MKDHQRYNYHDRIVDEAADWFARLQNPQLDPEDRTAFADWLCASAEHVREYLALTNLHTDISELPIAQSAENLIERARRAHTENVIPLNLLSLPEGPEGLVSQEEAFGTGRAAASTGRDRIKKIAALAASIALVTLACVWLLYPNVNTANYTTSIGEQRSFPLPDGSLVTLNAVSKLRMRYTERYRDVQLLSGEALFTVAKNKLKPFRVLTDDSVIQAIGTQFNVYHRRASTTVTVVEGTVEIRSATSQAPAENASRVTKGQRARMGAENARITVSAADAAVEMAWRERRLTFESRPLGDVVAEFNLYNEVSLEIRDPALNAVQVSGSFNADDPQSFASFLQEARLAKSKIQSERIVLAPLTER